jgi:hypothetical protein
MPRVADPFPVERYICAEVSSIGAPVDLLPLTMASVFGRMKTTSSDVSGLAGLFAGLFRSFEQYVVAPNLPQKREILNPREKEYV